MPMTVNNEELKGLEKQYEKEATSNSFNNSNAAATTWGWYRIYKRRRSNKILKSVFDVDEDGELDLYDISKHFDLARQACRFDFQIHFDHYGALMEVEQAFDLMEKIFEKLQDITAHIFEMNNPHIQKLRSKIKDKHEKKIDSRLQAYNQAHDDEKDDMSDSDSEEKEKKKEKTQDEFLWEACEEFIKAAIEMNEILDTMGGTKLVYKNYLGAVCHCLRRWNNPRKWKETAEAIASRQMALENKTTSNDVKHPACASWNYFCRAALLMSTILLKDMKLTEKRTVKSIGDIPTKKFIDDLFDEIDTKKQKFINRELMLTAVENSRARLSLPEDHKPPIKDTINRLCKVADANDDEQITKYQFACSIFDPDFKEYLHAYYGKFLEYN